MKISGSATNDLEFQDDGMQKGSFNTLKSVTWRVRPSRKNTLVYRIMSIELGECTKTPEKK